MNLFRKFFSSVFHFLVPDLCIHCGLELLDGEIGCCVFCNESLKNSPIKEVGQQLFISDEYVASVYVQFFFEKENAIQTLLHGLKYQGNFHIASFFANYFLSRFPQEICSTEGLMPVPIHPKKRFKRGYNQCDLIARHLCYTLQKPRLNSLVFKVVNNASQTRKNKGERMENTKNTFWVSPEIKRYTHLGIIEDVLTTGATIRALTNAIKQVHPSLKISFFVVASAVECKENS
ncbi:MAG: ComF family protein [Flavobacteriales bacterium]